MKTALVAMLAAWVALTPAAFAGKSRSGAKAGFKKIQKILKDEESDLHSVVIPDSLVKDRRSWKPEDVKAWREGLVELLADAKVAKVRESGDDAVVRITGARKSEMEILLRYSDSRWIVGSAEAFLVSGKPLTDAGAGGPARVTLEMRTKNDSMGTSAFSFSYVTKDVEKCKNRIDIWFCRCGNLHTGGRSLATGLGSKALGKVNEIPVGTEWKREVKPEKGAAFVVRCLDPDRTDFFVKARVVSVRESALTLEWELLTTGRGAPTKIDEPVSMDPNDRSGANGLPGICGLSGKAGRDGKSGSGGRGGKGGTGR